LISQFKENRQPHIDLVDEEFIFEDDQYKEQHLLIFDMNEQEKVQIAGADLSSPLVFHQQRIIQ